MTKKEMKIVEEPYPITIIADRYNGTYSGGKWTAWNQDFYDIPKEIDGDDVTCFEFWNDNMEVVGLGNTPEEACLDLITKIRRIAEGQLV